jgi:hypothetical protein
VLITEISHNSINVFITPYAISLSYLMGSFRRYCQVEKVNTTLVLFPTGYFMYPQQKMNRSINQMKLLVHFMRHTLSWLYKMPATVFNAQPCSVQTRIYCPLHHFLMFSYVSSIHSWTENFTLTPVDYLCHYIP